MNCNVGTYGRARGIVARRNEKARVATGSERAVDVERQISTRTNCAAITIIDESVDIRGREVSANFDRNVSASTNMAAWIGREVVVLE